MSNRRAVCIVVDGLRVSALGTYGNTIYPTPHFDELAAGSLVADWLIADSPTLEGFYRSVWNGQHVLRHVVDLPGPSLPEHLRQGNVLTWLMTDDHWVAAEAEKAGFDETTVVELTVTPQDTAEAPVQAAETHFAQFFSLAADVCEAWLEKSRQGQSDSLLWIHSRGLFTPWDAPSELREQMADDDEAVDLDVLGPPQGIFEETDPDRLLSHRVAYAAQVALLDEYLGGFCQLVEGSHEAETLIMLLGSRGFALGEHGHVGTEVAELYSENVHLPWLLRQVGRKSPGERSPGLFQPADVGHTIADWFGQLAEWSRGAAVSLLAQEVVNVAVEQPAIVAVGTQGERMIRTADWQLHCRQLAGEAIETAELYNKPDDRWEFNDVASRCPEIVEQLSELLINFANSNRVVSD